MRVIGGIVTLICNFIGFAGILTCLAAITLVAMLMLPFIYLNSVNFD